VSAPQQERFRWSLWPVCVGWVLALWLAWHGLADLAQLAKGVLPIRGFVFGFLNGWSLKLQMALAAAQIALLLLAAPSFIGWITQRILLTVGDTGVTFEGWRGWRRLAWRDIEKLEFSFGDAIFSARENGKLSRIRFRPWTIGLDSDEFRSLIERHQPRLTPDDEDGQPWARSSSFNS
jgi:hypothetical protein